MRGQMSGSGRPSNPSRSLDGSSGRFLGGPQLLGGLSKLGPAEESFTPTFGAVGLVPTLTTSMEAGLVGSVSQPLVEESGPKFRGPSQPSFESRAQGGGIPSSVMSGPSSLGCLDSESTNFWVKDGLRKQIEAELHSKVRSLTDHALLEEALRYGIVSYPKGNLDSGLSSSFSFFPGRTPEGEYYNYSGVVCETVQGEIPLRMINALGLIED